MKFNIVEQEKNRLVIDIIGQGHSLCNTIKKELWKDSDVKIAGYFIEHPQIGIPRLFVETKGSKTPQEALVDAAKRVQKINEKFIKDFLDEVK